MDLALALIIILILSGSFIAFLIAMVSYVSQHKLNEQIKDNIKQAKKLDKIHSNYEVSINSLFSAELVLYCVAFFIAGGKFFVSDSPWLDIISILVLLSVLMSSRVFMYSFGVRYANDFISIFANLIHIIIKTLYPLVIIRKKITNHLGGEQNNDDSREEITALVETALEKGSLDEDEYRLMTQIMKFSEVQVADVLTPRSVVFSCDCTKKVSEVASYKELEEYSRFPIWKGDSIDSEIIGYVLSRDILINKINNKGDLTLEELSKKVFHINEANKLDFALEHFLKNKQHIAIVIDKIGGFEGVLTMEDVLETIIGAEIVDEGDKTVDLRQLAKNKRDRRLSSRKKK